MMCAHACVMMWGLKFKSMYRYHGGRLFIIDYRIAGLDIEYLSDNYQGLVRVIKRFALCPFVVKILTNVTLAS